MLCCKIVRNPLPQRLGFSQLSYRCKWLTRAKDPVSEVPPSQELNPNWKKLAVSLFLCGSISGPLLDSIHSRTQLQIYDSLPVDLSVFNLEFHSSIWVSPLLGTFYVVLGMHFSEYFIFFVSKVDCIYGWTVSTIQIVLCLRGVSLL